MIQWTSAIAAFCLISAASLAQPPSLTPEKLGYTSHSLETIQLGKVNYYVRNPEHDSNKPLLIYLDGSGPYPLFQRMKQGYGSTMLIQEKSLLSKFNLVLISKPGVPFVDDMEMDTATGMPIYEPPEEYTQRLSLDWRVNSTKGVIDELLGKHGLTPTKVIVIGVSEGFHVGAKLAAIEPRITHVGLFVGNGLNQFYDFMIAERMRAERGERTAVDAQTEIEQLLETAKEIYADPDSTEKHWMGHTYKRWASFGSSAPLEHLLKIKSPVFVACCSLDKNTSIVSADYIPLEFAKRGKKNLTYKVYPYAHSFIETTIDQDGKPNGIKPHFEEVLLEFIEWTGS
jgi:pimeloyl-ACP methyl ester carboxylesterase